MAVSNNGGVSQPGGGWGGCPEAFPTNLGTNAMVPLQLLVPYTTQSLLRPLPTAPLQAMVSKSGLTCTFNAALYSTLGSVVH